MMYLKSIELGGFKSFGKKTSFVFTSPIAGIVGPNGSGKCVTGDALLSRRTRTRDDTLTFENVAIAAIRAGDEIQTLDVEAGRLSVSRVNALADMGVKDIFELTTATGKKIRTTANHPYLALLSSVPRLRVALFIDGANVESSARRMNARIDYAGFRASFGGDHVVHAG